MTHELKILPQYFEEVAKGRKTFEIRYNDRNYQVGDTLILNEYHDGYTGNSITAKITYILADTTYLQPGFVAMGICIFDASHDIPRIILSKEEYEKIKRDVEEEK